MSALPDHSGSVIRYSTGISILFCCGLLRWEDYPITFNDHDLLVFKTLIYSGALLRLTSVFAVK